ncbi:MAG: DUF3467 domain-containing protein [Thermoleophilia bacterium]|nr:DUF3467 domain-containing protein [Thermoleophilia bacterium]
MSQPDERPTEFQIQVPPELEAGVYANFLSVWHTAYEFTLDFGVTQPPQVETPEDPDAPVRVGCRVVSRVKIPVTVLFDVLRALNENMTRYEAVFGEIRRPESPEPPGTSGS